MTSPDSPITEFMTHDHVELDDLLTQAANGNAESYRIFRERLLRHIRMEERILLPMAESKRGEALPQAARLRADHGALAALMMLPPHPGTVHAVRTILKGHNP